MNLQQALNNLDVINFQIEQRERCGRDVPSVLLDQRAFYEAEVASLQAAARESHIRRDR